MECDWFGFDFTIFDVNFVFIKNNRDVFIYFDKIFVLVGYIFVRYFWGDIKYDNGILILNVVVITKVIKFFLFSCVLYVKADGFFVCIEYKWMYFNF